MNRLRCGWFVPASEALVPPARCEAR